MKARTHVAAAVLAFAALPLVLVKWSGFEDRRDAAARTSDLVLSGNAEELSNLLVASRARWLESVRADARLPGLEDLLAVDPPPDPVRLSRFFGAVGSRDAVNIRSIGLVDLKGRVLEDSHAAHRGSDESLEPWFLRAMATGQPQMVGPYTPAGATAPGLYFAALVRDAAEQRRGLLRVRVEPGALAQVLASALVASPGLSATLVDADGRALIGVGPRGDAPLLLDAATGAQAPQVLDIGAERVSVAPVAHSPWRAAVRQPLAAWSAPQQALRREWLFETALLLVLLLAASLLLGQRIAAPLARFSAIAGRMAEGDFGPVPRWPGADEARQLGEALDGLATRLRETIGSLSRELEQRREAEQDLQRLADTLEHRVAERTRELEAANEALSQAMKQLVQREKLASLGSLVAGVAHELNTPIGNALTVSTALNDIHRQFASDLASGQLKRSSLDRFVQENSEAAALIERNLQRAASLISHFKQVAVDQASVRRRTFDLAEVVIDVLSTLSPRLKHLPHEVEVDIPDGLCMESYPGPLEQVLTNLLENSLVHAFGPREAGRIRISARAEGHRVALRYEDNGCGIPAEVRHRIFDPFFTTRLGQGGSGLGLYLVYNLVHGRLGGSIQLTDCEGRGTCFIVDLPMLAPAAAEESME